MKRLPWWMAGLTVVCSMMHGAGLASAAPSESIPAVIEADEGDSGGMRILWQAEPGVRYDLRTSQDLNAGFDPVPGFPTEATALWQEHRFPVADRAFFRIEKLDEQHPVIIEQYPTADGFAVGRSADLYILLSDPSGIDAASITISVGTNGPVAYGEAGLAFADNAVTFDSGDNPLGGWGETVSATLVVADGHGNTLTNTWSFRLETEPEVAADVFIFGSQSAQVQGQRVEGPAAVLSALSEAPIKPAAIWPSESTWAIDRVESNRVIVAYAEGNMPSFHADQLLCNLTPRAENEIFYRRVLAVSNDAAGLRLILDTEDAPLTDFVKQGSAAISSESIILQMDTNGVMVSSIAIGGTLSFPRIGMNLSGTEFALKEDGFEITVPGRHSYSIGSAMNWLEVKLTEYEWWFTPRVQAGIELDLSGVKSFEAIAQGDVSIANVIDGNVVLVGIAAELELFDLKGPQHVMLLGVIPPGIPVLATLGVNMGLTAKAEAKTQAAFSATYRQDFSSSFGMAYARASGHEWIHQFQATAPDLRGDAELNEELSFHLVLDPRLEFLVYGLAGVKAAVEPSAGVVVEVPLSGGDFDGRLEADVDFVLGTAGDVFDLLNISEELRLNLWHGEWPFVRQDLVFTTQPRGATVKVGEAVSFTCIVDAPTTPSYQWFHRGMAIPGQTSRSLFLPRVNETHSGTYFVRATTGGMTRDSEPAILTVQTQTQPVPSGMALIPAGSFQMGDSFGEGWSEEVPVHSVYVSAFYMDKYEVSKALWDEVYNWATNHGYAFNDFYGSGKAANHPMRDISWYDAVKWCNARSEKEGRTPAYYLSSSRTEVYRSGWVDVRNDWVRWDMGYRLPTEAEWEKAARGGRSSRRFPWGDTISHSQANYYSDASYGYDISLTREFHPLYNTGDDWNYTSPVGAFAPNGYGLYDMAGNVWEWCWDWFDSYGSGSQTDPRGPVDPSGYWGSSRVIRGGSWGGFAHACRVADRYNGGAPAGHWADMGFRAVLPPGQQ